MKKSNIVMTALFAVFAAGVIFVSCGNGTTGGGGGGGGRIDPAILGKWYSELYMLNPDISSDFNYEFMSDGKIVVYGMVAPYLFSTSGGKLTFYWNGPETPYARPGERMGGVNYSVNGDKITFSYTEGGIIQNGNFYRLGSTVTPDEDGKNTTLRAPTNIRASATSSNEITVSWSSVSGADEYNVYRASSASGPYSLVTTAYSTSYTDTYLSASTKYYYKVSAYDNDNYTESPQSSYATATTKAESSGGGTATTDFAYKDVSGGVEITDYYGSTLDVNIPATIDGKAVVRIGNYAFWNNELTSVIIPNSVTTIEDNAFRGNIIPGQHQRLDSLYIVPNMATKYNTLQEAQLASEMGA